MERRVEDTEMGRGGRTTMEREMRHLTLMTMTVSSEEDKQNERWNTCVYYCVSAVHLYIQQAAENKHKFNFLNFP